MLTGVPVAVEEKQAQPQPVKKILIADDNHDAADTLAMVFEFMGHGVEVAYDGAEAVHLGGEHLPDVAVLDINMPVMDGYEAARELRRMAGAKPLLLVAVTGAANRETSDRASQAGFDAYFPKPVDLDLLLALV
jgi:CheY-like chemotaxis protein